MRPLEFVEADEARLAKMPGCAYMKRLYGVGVERMSQAEASAAARSDNLADLAMQRRVYRMQAKEREA